MLQGIGENFEHDRQLVVAETTEEHQVELMVKTIVDGHADVTAMTKAKIKKV